MPDSEILIIDKIKKFQELLAAWESSTVVETKLSAEEVVKIASELISADKLKYLDRDSARTYLNLTSSSNFLRQLKYPDGCYEWAETCFAFIQHSGYKLFNLFEERVRESPDGIMFVDLSVNPSRRWTRAEVSHYLKLLAGSFFLLSGDNDPRVAIFSENSFDTACCDLASLFYDILVSPINPSFSFENLEMIFDQLQFNLAITDSPERLKLLERLKQKTGRNFEILLTRRFEIPDSQARLLGQQVRSLDQSKVEDLLRHRRHRSLTEVSTVMFTSGSTGQPKGVSFSEYNLITKRFARAAALPQVGQDEVLLAFLPLYHTFGRYFELLGSIFWRGTYVFSGNPSAATLLNLFPQVNPTGLVSVPIRWLQIYERCLEKVGQVSSKEGKREAVRSVIGSNLRWGISAAGYLEPKVFHFFEKHEVNLVSGFGLTEATGGLTMTPPGRYVDNTQGLPLPGVELKLSEEGELLARGHYIARYLEDKGPGDEIPYPGDPETDYWLRTGDIFRILPNGYYQIVDRIKDIYKNNRGQTIAPRKVEDKFKSVPGIKRAFLVGDGRPFNILLIVPDSDCPELTQTLGKEGEKEYYKRIIEAANLDLATYERIINFALLDRDFSREKGELTAKGSYNRKTIVANFSDLIEDLYKKDYLEFRGKTYRLKIPFWVIRDLGLLEDDFKLADGCLNDRSRSLSLIIEEAGEGKRYRIGDLVYELKDDLIDLGLFARQPFLWCGNPALVQFLRVKEGWDTPMSNVSNRIRLASEEAEISYQKIPAPHGLTDPSLIRVHQLVASLYFGSNEEAIRAMTQIERLFFESENLRISTLIRLRLEALANHRDEKVRCWAYRLLILDQPRPDYVPSLEDFVESGRTFLSKESIEEIASSALGSGRFEALRRRLAGYRASLKWPASPSTHAQFRHIFQLLVGFAQVHPEYRPDVVAELASWALHQQDQILSAEAERLIENLNLVLRLQIKVSLPETYQQGLEKSLRFSGQFSEAEKKRISQVLGDPTFLIESLRTGYGDYITGPESIASAQIRISRVASIYEGLHLRVCLNTTEGEHYDFRLEIHEGQLGESYREKVYWYLVLSEHYDFPGLLPRLASWRPDLGAISYRFFSRLSVDERIRDFAGRNQSQQPAITAQEWRMLYIRAISLIYQAVQASDFKLIPGEGLPENVSVEAGRPVLINPGNLIKYRGPGSLMKSIVDNFYLKIVAAYPWAEKIIDLSWLFDAFYEIWEEDKVNNFLKEIQAELKRQDIEVEGFGSLRSHLESYLSEISQNPVLPVSVLFAIRKYKEWELTWRQAGPAEREKKILELIDEFNLESRPEWIRFYFYRHTYFASTNAEVVLTFEKLLEKMKENPDKLAIQFVELSELQSQLKEEADRQVFSRMVFPRTGQIRELDFQKTGEIGQEKLIIRSGINDRLGNQFTFRQSYDPAEIGQLYRLFLMDNYPSVISQENQNLVLLDPEGYLVGGICFRNLSRQVVFLEGIVVARGYKNRGLGRAMLRDFISRMISSGVRVIMTHYLSPFFFMKEGFVLDKRWGALIKYLH
ncbi:MAG: GNAT family N-acetyltransferase [Acidobacteriota bacterium]|nr:GNAT family N-acetyltransferase [Acidobacteriota bacterium]MDW3228270.1 GNAT family N-acetyltransferase [Acidobacteriota bacterium]MDY0230987.1 GNAT family N-acetyltransferase [Candidatus Saccharicenans sp.]